MIKVNDKEYLFDAEIEVNLWNDRGKFKINVSNLESLINMIYSIAKTNQNWGYHGINSEHEGVYIVSKEYFHKEVSKQQLEGTERAMEYYADKLKQIREIVA